MSSCPFNNYHNDSTQCRYCSEISLDCLSCHARVCTNPSDPRELKDRIAALEVAVEKMRTDLTALVDIEAVNADVKRLVDARAAEQEAVVNGERSRREWFSSMSGIPIEHVKESLFK